MSIGKTKKSILRPQQVPGEYNTTLFSGWVDGRQQSKDSSLLTALGDLESFAALTHPQGPDSAWRTKGQPLLYNEESSSTGFPAQHPS